MRACNTALHLSSGKAVKAWFRRSQAFVGMGDHLNSYYDLKQAAVLAPEDSLVRKSLAEAYHPLEARARLTLTLTLTLTPTHARIRLESELRP